MTRTTVLASLLSVLIVLTIGIVWSLQPDDPRLEEQARGTGAAADPMPLPAHAATTPTETTDSGSRSEAVPPATTAPPVPPDAPWVSIRAIDRATKAPVADATVHWVDDTSDAAMARTPGLNAVDQTILRANTEAFARRFGWRTTTDANGMARVSRNGWLTVTAATPGSYGELYIEPDLLAPADGFVVELAPDHRIVVQVVDDRGDPVADVSVALYARDIGRGTCAPGAWATKARTRAPDGIAILEHVQAERPPLHDPSEHPDDWRVCALPLVPGDFGAKVSIDDPPTEPVVLRLPTCGRVVVEPPRGPGVPDIGLLGAMLADATTHVGVGVGTARSDGTWLFPRVPIGRHYTAQSSSNSIGTLSFAGPTERDEEITVRLPLVPNRILLAARILGDDGQPVRDATIGMLVEGNRFHGNAWLRSDAAGRVLATWNELGTDDRFERLAFFRSAPVPGHGEIVPREVRVGLNELGDVLLTTRHPLVCSGRFVNLDGSSPREIEFEVEHRAAPDETGRAPEWDEATMLSIHHEENGRFAVLGTPPPGELRLVFPTSQQLPHDPVPFLIGTRDLEIAFETQLSLSASVLVPRDAPEFPIVAELVPTARPANVGEDDDRATIERENHHANAAGAGERRNLHWSTLRRGTYTLELRSWFDAEPIVRIPDVVVPPPASGDRRLEDIDLRGALRLLHVRMLDATGELAENAGGVAFLDGLAPGTSWRGFAYRDPEFALLVPKGPLALLFAGSRLPPRVLRADGEHLDVKFLPWSTLDLVIADIPPLPDGVRVIASLDAQDRREIHVHEQGDTNSSAELNDVPGSYVRIVDGRASLPIGDGPHTLSLGLAHANGRIALGLLEEELQVTATTPPPVVRVSPERWEWAIRSLLDDVAKDAERRRSGR